MRRDTFNFLLNSIRRQLAKVVVDNVLQGQGCGRNTVYPEKQLMVALWTLATPDSYRSVCDRFNIGRATAIRSVRRVVKALCSIRAEFIKWPTENEIMQICATFEAQKGFPNVLGAVDGTHIKIVAPKENAESYINRKGFHAIQLQVVCDNTLKFIHCYAGYPGSVHDQRVFRVSDLQNICGDHDKFPNDTHLIGDAAYSIQQHLMVPYRDNGRLTHSQRNFNHSLSATRMVIERAIGLLKGRFRSLLDRLPMTRTDLIPSYIMACCVLHNICLLRRDMIEIPVIAENRAEQIRDDVRPVLHIEGVQKRTRITNALQMRAN